MKKTWFTQCLAKQPDRLHFAAHSHHLWPDITKNAALQYWEDSTNLLDNKWQHIFGKVIPELQNEIANVFTLPQSQNIAFAPNVHEFLNRLLSCSNSGKTTRILTTDSEFYSFTRQVGRLEEENLVIVDRITVNPFTSFTERFCQQIQEQDYDIIYLSHVFFNSGYWIADKDLQAIVATVKNSETIIVIDGYHSFMAVPVDLSSIAHRVFYTSGGYKYAMSGEGVCFLAVPEGCQLRPRNTGWFAAFGNLEGCQPNITAYSNDGMRFAGATFDPTGVYRMRAVLQKLREENITVTKIHDYVHDLQNYFCQQLDLLELEDLNSSYLVVPPSEKQRGNFLTFHSDKAQEIHRTLMDNQIITDVRNKALRFGFGIYQEHSDIDKLCLKLKKLF